MIATIATIAATAGKKNVQQSLWSYGNHTSTAKTPFSWFPCGRWKRNFSTLMDQSIWSSLPCKKAARKINLNAKWRKILCYKKTQNIGVLCLAGFPFDFRGLRDCIFDCNFKKQFHFVICQNKRVILAPAFRSTRFLSWLRQLGLCSCKLPSYTFLTKTDTRTEENEATCCLAG